MADTPAQAALRAAFNTRLPTAGGTMTGALILSGDPSNDMEAVTKQYVDDSVSGISWDSLQGKPNLATVATSGNYNDLSNRPSIPSSPNAYVTSSWKSGSSWYRTWSDGFKECGGYVSTSDSTNDASITFSFPITISTRINVVAQTLDWYNSQYACQYAVTGTSSTSFTIRRSGSVTKKFYYYACGY